MARGVLRLDPVKLLMSYGLTGMECVGARLFAGRIEIIVDGPDMPDAPKGKIPEVVPAKGGRRKAGDSGRPEFLEYEEREMEENPVKLK